MYNTSLKFRAWNEKKRKMLSSEELSSAKMIVGVDNSRLIVLQGTKSGYVEKDGLIPMQSTGMRDKHQELIYEGDVVRVIYRLQRDLGKGKEEYSFSRWGIWLGVVEKSGYGYGINQYGHFTPKLEQDGAQEVEVLGNIYANKGLRDRYSLYTKDEAKANPFYDEIDLSDLPF